MGTVYNQELLKKIRENAYGYLHGHAVGGTNPSLLEALATTKLNLLFDVSFNNEVGRDSAYYFNATNGNLSNLIEDLEDISKSEIEYKANLAKCIIGKDYCWNKIVSEYEELFASESRTL